MSPERLTLAGGEIDAMALVEFFEQLAACPRDGAGAWMFEVGSTQLGLLLIEDGQICWSTLPGRRKRLLEILQRVSGSEMPALETALRACITAKTPITEGLVKAGVVSAAQLVVALKRDTLESLLAIARTPERRGIWRPHRAGGYGASVRFSLTELMLDAASELLSAPRATLLGSAESLFGDSGHFLYVSREGLPVAASASVAMLSIPDCLALARRADDLAGSSASQIVAGSEPNARSVTMVWREGPWVGVVQTEGAPHATLRKLMALGVKTA